MFLRRNQENFSHFLKFKTRKNVCNKLVIKLLIYDLSNVDYLRTFRAMSFLIYRYR